MLIGAHPVAERDLPQRDRHRRRRRLAPPDAVRAGDRAGLHLRRNRRRATRSAGAGRQRRISATCGAVARSLQATDAGKQMRSCASSSSTSTTPSVTSMQKPNITAQNIVPGFNDVAADMIKETESFIDRRGHQQGRWAQGAAHRRHHQPVGGAGRLLRLPGRRPVPDCASLMRPRGARLGHPGPGRVPGDARVVGFVVADQARPVPVLPPVLPADATPPPNVPQIGQPMPGDEDHAPALRGARTRLPAAPAAACHRRFDPIGFGFEHFDEGGRYRDKEKACDINSAGSVPDPDGSRQRRCSRSPARRTW